MPYRFTQDNFHPEPPRAVMRGASSLGVAIGQVLLSIVIFCSLVDVLELLLAGRVLHAVANAVLVCVLASFGRCKW